MTGLLEIEELSVGLASNQGAPLLVLDRVNLTIRKGEILCLVGESGSGKSMTALSVMGLLPPGVEVISGSIRLNGQELLGLSDTQWRTIRGGAIGMVFQDPMTGLNPVRTIGAQLSETIRRHQGSGKEQALAIAEAVLASLGVPAARERLSVFPHQLSGGLRQRVMIALAIVNRPGLIIADEPTTALDTTIQAQILDLLRDRLAEAGGLMITHDLAVAAEIADRISVIYHGRIIEEGPAQSVLTDPRHPYTAGLIEAVPDFGHKGRPLVPIPGQPPPPAALRQFCSFRDRCRFASPACAEMPALSAAGKSRKVACHHALHRGAAG